MHLRAQRVRGMRTISAVSDGTKVHEAAVSAVVLRQ
jgi:hypothetical protein